MTVGDIRSRPLQWLVLFVIGPLGFFAYSQILVDPVFTRQRDFGVFYAAAIMLWRGMVPGLFDPETFRAGLASVMGPDFIYMPFPYPPHSLLLLWPIAAFSFLGALAFWLAASIGAVIVAAREPVMRHWYMIAAFLFSPASAVNLANGQNGFWSAALLCGAFLQIPQRPIIAGILFGIISYKPQFGILIPLLLIVGGQWRTFAAATVTVFVMVAASILLFGIDSWIYFLDRSAPLQVQLVQSETGPFLLMTPTIFMTARLIGLPLWIGWVGQAAISVVALVAALWVYRKNTAYPMKVATILFAIYLCSPYALTYDLTIVNLAILLALSSFRPRWWEMMAFVLVWIIPTFVFWTELPAGPFFLLLAFVIVLRRVEQGESGVARVEDNAPLPQSTS